MSQLRIKSSDLSRDARPGRLRRAMEAALYPLFSVLLLIPLARRWRRGPRWGAARWTGWIAGGAMLAAGLSTGLAPLSAAGVLLLALATLLAPLADPEAGRILAQRLGAQHALPAGFYVDGGLGFPPGEPVQMFLSAREVVLVPQGPAPVVVRFPLAELAAVRIDGKIYRPRYVSFAKEPPRREQTVDRDAACRLGLDFGARRLELEYRGTFARHVAEAAAHALDELRRLATDHVAGQAPEVFHIVRGQDVAE